jgi:hypothetical protein
MITGGVALIAATVIWFRDRATRPEQVDPLAWLSLLMTLAILVFAVAVKLTWDHFNRNAHGIAADTFFVFLFGAIVANVVQHRRERPWRFGIPYSAVAAAMALGALTALGFDLGEKEIFWLEAWEIAWFSAYWLLQTVENWDEEVDCEDTRVARATTG